MPLIKSSLAEALANIFENQPSTSAEAGLLWAQAYLSYASGALSSAGSLPVSALAGMAILVGAFTAAFETRQAQAAALAISGGVMAFWQAMVWTGPTAAGSTAAPGNFALTAALLTIFADQGGAGAREKADQLADAFDAGAKLVIVVDIPFAQPAPPIVGPIQ